MIIILTKDYIPSIQELFGDEADDDTELEGYCLKLDPRVCSCGSISEYFEPPMFHVILVWKEKDDDVLLEVAKTAIKIGQDAHIVEYQPDFGKGIDFDEALKIGMLV